MGSSIDRISRKSSGINLVVFIGVVRIGQEKSPASSVSDLIAVDRNRRSISFFNLIDSRLGFSSVQENINA